MERIAYFADFSVKRACSFATLAIGTLLVGFSYQFEMVAKLGAVLFTLQGVVLLIFARRRYPGRAYRRTELWALIGKRLDIDLPEERVREIVTATLRDAYLRYFRITAGVAGLFWVVTMGILVVRLLS